MMRTSFVVQLKVLHGSFFQIIPQIINLSLNAHVTCSRTFMRGRQPYIATSFTTELSIHLEFFSVFCIVSSLDGFLCRT